MNTTQCIILNSLNVLTAKKGGKPYYLSRDDKILVMNELFLQKKNVTYAHVKFLLHLDYFGTKAGDESDKFTTGYTVYFDIIRTLPILKLLCCLTDYTVEVCGYDLRQSPLCICTNDV